MNPKSSVPFGLLKLPGMNAIQAAFQPRSAGASQPVNCKSSKDRDSLVQHQANMAYHAQQLNPPAGWQRGIVPTAHPLASASIGARPGSPQPGPMPLVRHAPLNFRKS
jgi:hypothetical protein